MEETTNYILRVTMKTGREYEFEVTDTELDWLYDRLFEREKGDFQNFSGCVINVKDIEFLEYREVVKEEE